MRKNQKDKLEVTNKRVKKVRKQKVVKEPCLSTITAESSSCEELVLSETSESQLKVSVETSEQKNKDESSSIKEAGFGKKTLVFGAESLPIIGPVFLAGQAISGQGVDGYLSNKERTKKAMESVVSVVPGLGTVSRALLSPLINKGIDFFWKNDPDVRKKK